MHFSLESPSKVMSKLIHPAGCTYKAFISWLLEAELDLEEDTPQTTISTYTLWQARPGKQPCFKSHG